MRKSEEILRQLHEQGEMLEIPKSLEPEQMRETLKKQKGRRTVRKLHFYPAAAVACLFLAVGIMAGIRGGGQLSHEGQLSGKWAAADVFFSRTPEEIAEENLRIPQMTYEDIYAKLSQTWDAQSIRKNGIREESSVDVATAMTEGAADLSASKDVFGKTNVQVEQVDEADRIKNDGRYLYQIAYKTSEDGSGENWGIQIIDTENGLKEVAFLDEFGSVEEFYVWEDLLIAVENKYLESAGSVPRAVEDMAISYKYGFMQENQYHEISVYNIEDRARPQKLKTFTLKGSYETSRISDGYFYGISRFWADPGEGKEDYGAYVPVLDGKPLPADRIYCPEEIEGSSFLVMVSIELKEPSSIADSRAVLAGEGIYYVSQKNIYMTQYKSLYGDTPSKKGTTTDKTEILRFAYRNGKFYAQAKGEIPGRLNDSFSLDEYNGYLRAVTTVQKCNAKEVMDDRTGESIGFDYSDVKESNSLYVLDGNLSVKGKIEGLARDEMVYSARFMGDTGYFVTFRQMDPLFAVDLSDPADPTVLGELKVSGFSEYLHFYGENQLLGIGMEADEETGQQKGMKLSMFDISNPAELVEKAKLNLKGYNYSEALYDHRAVLIDTDENLIGFSAEGSNMGKYWKRYLVFSYENGEFVKKLGADIMEEDGGYYNTRGTFIGKVLYLLGENGSVRAYDRESGKMVEEI